MVGGKVIEIVKLDDRIWLDVQDTIYQRDPTCAIYIVRNTVSEQIEVGDMVWWQGRFLMWKDERILRASYSGVGVPDNYFSQ